MQPSLLVGRSFGARRLQGLPALSVALVLGWGGCSTSAQSGGTGGSSAGSGGSHSGGSDGKSSSGGSDGSGGTPAATGGSRGSGGSGGSSGSGGKSADSGGNGSGGSSASGGAVGSGGTSSGSGGAAAPSGSGGQSASSGGSSGATGVTGSGGGTAHAQDHCTAGFTADARDAQITTNPDTWTSPMNGAVDLVVPKGVLDWMGERVWEKSHDAWHNIRRCKTSGASNSICQNTALIPDHQECSDAEDGYEFLVMHRHMMQGLRQAFPQHQAVFDGFPSFPFDATDVPQQWQGRWGSGWSSQIVATAKTLEAIEQNLSMFPTEGDLGKFIQCGTMSSGASSIHGALHFMWVVNDSPYSLGKQAVNIDNYMFWKLHGWIDHIWERYRAAKGLTDDEPKLQQALISQCQEMEQLGELFDPSIGKMPDAPLPVEHGEFVDTVRPILEQICSGCHSETSPEANMSLGGHISSADVVKNLVNATSSYGGQFKRVVPGDPSKSWLYLKVSGMAMSAGCTGSMCNTEVMPPTGAVTLTTEQLAAISKWISAGAPAPTQ